MIIGIVAIYYYYHINMCCVSWIQIYNTGGPNLTAHQPVRVQMCDRNPQGHSSDLPSTLDRWPMSGVTLKSSIEHWTYVTPLIMDPLAMSGVILSDLFSMGLWPYAGASLWANRILTAAASILMIVIISKPPWFVPQLCVWSHDTINTGNRYDSHRKSSCL